MGSAGRGFYLQTIGHAQQWSRITSRFRSKLLVRATGGLLKCSDLLESTMRRHIGRIDSHTLEALASMGHPYGRGGAGDRAAPPHSPFGVHIQFNVRRGGGITVSSLMIDAIFNEIKVRGLNEVLVKVGVDTTRAPHAIYIVDGTRYMIQRDFLRGSYEEIKSKLGGLFDKGFSRGYL